MSPRFRRSASTLKLYAAYGVFGYLLAGFGIILPELRAELSLGRAEIALYPSAFALGLIAVGAVGDRILRALGGAALGAALGTQAVGALLLCSHWGRSASGAGALLMGIGGATLVNFVPAKLRAEHGEATAIAIGEATGVSSASSVAAPLVIGATLAADLGWRAGFAIPPLLAAIPLVVAGAAGSPAEGGGSVSRMPAEFFFRWMDIVMVVAVEFCVLFWAADFMRTERGVTAGAAAALAALFVLGMAVARAASEVIARFGIPPRRLLASSALVATAGFLLLWLVDHWVAAGAGLFVTGLGVSLLYPVTLAEAFAAWPNNPNRAAARAALASGCAIGAAPLSLGMLADAISLRIGVLLAPALLIAFAIRCLLRRPVASR